MSEEGEGTEEARKVVASKKEGNALDLSGEVIMDSNGSTKEEGKLNTPVTVHYTSPSSSSSPSFLAQVSNMASEISLVSEIMVFNPRMIVKQRQSSDIEELSTFLMI